jgi:hypothetical protein
MSSYESHQNPNSLDLGSFSKYLELRFFSYIFDWRQAVLNSMNRSAIWITTLYIFVWHMRMPKEDNTLPYLLMWHYNQYLVKACPRRQDSGPTKTELDPLPASAAAASFLWISQWAKTHSRRILLDRATPKTHLTFVGVNI